MDSVSIVGGTGFVGRYLISALKSGNPSRDIRLLSRNPPQEKIEGVVWRKADVTRPESLGNALEGCASTYYLPGILAETKDQNYEDVHYNGVIGVLRALSKSASPGRFVHVSAIGASANAPSAYHRTKKKAEEAVAASGIPFTIVRPSLVFGQGDRSINQFLAFGRSLHVLPMIGPGTARIQPVFAGDLAKVLAKIPDHSEMGGEGDRGGGSPYIHLSGNDGIPPEKCQPESFHHPGSGRNDDGLGSPSETPSSQTLSDAGCHPDGSCRQCRPKELACGRFRNESCLS